MWLDEATTMSGEPESVTLGVAGMTCGRCEARIEGAIGALEGVGRVRASAALGEVRVSFDPGRVGVDALEAAIADAGYGVLSRARQPDRRAQGGGALWGRVLGLTVIAAAAYLILRSTATLPLLPAVTQSMGYGLIFVVGLLTSLHCVAMCGGIVLSQGIARNRSEGAPSGAPAAGRLGERMAPSLLYNAGRVLSYTVIGGIVGAVGSVVTLSPAFRGVMPIVAGAFMLILGLRMLGTFPWLSRLRIGLPWLPRSRIARAASRRGSFVIGLANGLMPCGPLQTMQLYALGAGGFAAGALSMFLFSIGTVPLLLGLGVAGSLLTAVSGRWLAKASGALVMVLGLVMAGRGLDLSGVSRPAIVREAPGTAAVAERVGSGQEVRSAVESGRYQPIVVQAGIPLRWTISVEADDLNGCNNPVTVPQLGITKELTPGDNVIELTPPSGPGTITFTCWMGMISGTIRVVDDLGAARGR